VWIRRRPEWITAALAVALGVAYLLLPPMGTDLAAQVARGAFFADHGYTPIDLRWYGGVDQLGYSFVSQPIMAVLGAELTGAVALVLAAVTFAILLRRTAAPRPLFGSLVGAVAIAGNLVSGRVTYGLGVFFGLLALLLLTYPRIRWLAVVAALLTAATSPVAGLFLGLAGVALVAARRWGAGLLVAVPAAIPLGLTALLFGDGGWMNISHANAVQSIVTGVVVALVVPVRAVRAGGVLAALGVLAAALIHTPVGLNATRLAAMFALPVLAGYAMLPRLRAAWQWVVVVVLLGAVTVWQPPVMIGDFQDRGNPTASASYFAPLRARLDQEDLTGRVEIPPTRDYWESARMGETPLARGWLRQADIDRNPLFFTTVPGASGTGVPLNASTYQSWLGELAVQFVAVPDAELSWPGRDEAALVTAGLPFLSLVWSGPHWKLYAVADPQPIVAPPATMVRQSATEIVFDAADTGAVPIRVRHYPWLTVNGGATVTASGDWTVVQVPAPGRYTLTSRVPGG
jgi:hypothetical protein